MSMAGRNNRGRLIHDVKNIPKDSLLKNNHERKNNTSQATSLPPEPEDSNVRELRGALAEAITEN
jgi:hypothetical protein